MNALQMPDINFDKELGKCKNMEDLVGKNVLIQRLFGGIIKQLLEAEMEENPDKNYRDGHSSKDIRTTFPIYDSLRKALFVNIVGNNLKHLSN